jgi:flagellar protein FlaG
MNIGSVPMNTGVNTPPQPVGPAQQRPQDEGGQVQNGQGAIAGYVQNGAGMAVGIRGTDAAAKGTDATTGVQDSKKGTDANGKGPDKEIKKEDVEKAVSSVNDYINKLRHRELQFSLDDESGKMLIKIMDTDTKKVIRQIPPENMLRLAENLGQDKGWLVEQKA